MSLFWHPLFKILCFLLPEGRLPTLLLHDASPRSGHLTGISVSVRTSERQRPRVAPTNLSQSWEKPRQATVAASVALSRCRAPKPPPISNLNLTVASSSSPWGFFFFFSVYAQLYTRDCPFLFVCPDLATLPIEGLPERCSDPRVCASSFL